MCTRYGKDGKGVSMSCKCSQATLTARGREPDRFRRAEPAARTPRPVKRRSSPVKVGHTDKQRAKRTEKCSFRPGGPK